MFALLCADINAHGVEAYDATGAMNDSIRTARFVYSTGEPMSYSKIKLYPPSSSGTEILQSLCDRNGYFSFAADEAGEWRVTVEDGMGHKGEITIEVDNTDDADNASETYTAGDSGSAGIKSIPLVLRCILGLSIILNVFAVYFFVLAKKKAGCREAQNAH